MKSETLRKRLTQNRPMTTVTIQIPEDVIEDLERIAPLLGFLGYQSPVRAYIGQGLRGDFERLDNDPVQTMIKAIDKLEAINDEESPEDRSKAIYLQGHVVSRRWGIYRYLS